MRLWHISLASLLPLCFAGTSPQKLFSLDTDEIISNDCCDLTYNDINSLNTKIRDKVNSLVQEDYFKHFQFQLDMNCPFFECQSICFSPGCQLDLDVHSTDYNYDLLVDSNGKNLEDLNQDSFLDSLCPPENKKIEDDGEWCDLNDKDGVIIDISRNPERFTGYLPTPEQNIWGMIYQHQLDGECPMEQKVFYRIISGFHSSVSTHLSNEYYNNLTNVWEPNLELFEFKVGNHIDRIENIYFNYALLVRAIIKISPYINDYKFNPLNQDYDTKVKNEIKDIVEYLPTSFNVFNEDLMFQDRQIKEDFKIKFKNVTKLMDCVTCDRCRLWGKIQSTGYATALKILFEDTKTSKALSKNEISSLFNTFDRLTKSIDSINKFNHLKVLRDHPELNQQESEQQEQLVLKFDEPNDFDNDVSPIDSFTKKGKLKKDETFNDKLNAELLEIWNALKFIGNSYINLPHNLKNIILYKVNIWWSKFVGIKPSEDNIEYLYDIVA